MFSTSRSSIRIVQGIVIRRDRTIEVRVSHNIRFEEGRLKDHRGGVANPAWVDRGEACGKYEVDLRLLVFHVLMN